MSREINYPRDTYCALTARANSYDYEGGKGYRILRWDANERYSFAVEIAPACHYAVADDRITARNVRMHSL